MSDDALRRSMLAITARRGPETTLELTGELDPATSPDLDAQLQALLAETGLTRVVLDLTGVTFLDSSGLRTLAAGSEALAKRSVALVLHAPSRNIRRVLEVSGLTELIEIDEVD